MGAAVSSYNKLVEAAPFETNAYSSGAIAIFCESLVHAAKPEPQLLNRCFRQYCVAFCITTPLAKLWYKLIDEVFKNYPNDVRIALLKTMLEQTLFAPMANFCFLASQRLLDNRDMEDIKKEYRSKFWSLQISNSAFWGPVSFIIFKSIPPPLRILFARFMSIFWMMFLIRKLK